MVPARTAGTAQSLFRPLDPVTDTEQIERLVERSRDQTVCSGSPDLLFDLVDR